jgi:methylglyoxal synthase
MKHVALIAHDAKKDEMVAFVRRRADALLGHHLVATATTGEVIERETGLQVHRLLSGPLGGDLQIGALIATGRVSAVIFLRDPLTAHPHEPDIAALMKACDTHNVPLATNVAAAEMVLCQLDVEPTPYPMPSGERQATRTSAAQPAVAAPSSTGSILPETAILAAIGCIDLLWTFYLLSTGRAREGNPFMLAIYHWLGPTGMIAGKAILLGGPLAIMEYARAHNEHLVRFTMRAGIIAYAAMLILAFVMRI